MVEMDGSLSKVMGIAFLYVADSCQTFHLSPTPRKASTRERADKISDETFEQVRAMRSESDDP
jgi:hypothetical protein